MPITTRQLVTNQYRLHSAKQLMESIDEPANNAYYVFVGNHLDYSNVSSIPQPVDSIAETEVDAYRNMIYGKRVSASDVKLMIRRNDYETGSVYDHYDDEDGVANNLQFNSNYYAVVNAGAYYHVFKCLDNAGASNSTVEPSFAEASATDQVYQTSDDYIWKYMYTVDSTTVAKFATSAYFPVVVNTYVQDAAVSGSIDVIKVEDAGRNYNNWTNGTFTVDDLRLDGDQLVYSINPSLNANGVAGFYTGCYLTITSGTGSGQSVKIVDYDVNSSFKYVTLETPFETPPAPDSHYEVNPGVNIYGDGTQVVNASARAIINSSGNTVHYIEMIEVGEGYKYATANITAPLVVGVSNSDIAELRPIIAPYGGHGYDPAAELAATTIGISIRLSNTDPDLPLTNDYRTVGLLRDPVFSEVSLTHSDSNGVFLSTEAFYKVVPVLFNSTGNAVVGSANVSSADGDFTNQLDVGELIYLKGNNEHQIATVNSIVNSTFITITPASLFSCSATLMYLTEIATSLSNIEYGTTVGTGTININASSVQVNGTGTAFTTELVSNTTHVFLFSNSTGGGEIRRVNAIANNTRLTLASNASFTNTSAQFIRIDTTVHANIRPGVQATTGFVRDVAVGSMVATNVSGILETGDLIVGVNSGAKAVVNVVSRSGVEKSFNTFNQMNKYIASITAGSFEADEVVYQTALASANAKFHSYTNSQNFYVTQQTGVFVTGNNVIGANSGAIAALTEAYPPEIIAGSGKVLYLEKIDTIERDNTSSDTIKLMLRF